MVIVNYPHFNNRYQNWNLKIFWYNMEIIIHSHLISYRFILSWQNKTKQTNKQTNKKKPVGQLEFQIILVICQFSSFYLLAFNYDNQLCYLQTKNVAVEINGSNSYLLIVSLLNMLSSSKNNKHVPSQI